VANHHHSGKARQIRSPENSDDDERNATNSGSDSPPEDNLPDHDDDLDKLIDHPSALSEKYQAEVHPQSPSL
jgi:hypothetical protein